MKRFFVYRGIHKFKPDVKFFDWEIHSNMNLRSELKIKPSAKKIHLADPVMLMGSCFSDNIGRKLEAFKFNVLINPFGTLYNPHSIFNLVDNISSELNNLDEKEIVFHQGIYRYLGFHSAISSPDKKQLTDYAATAFRNSTQFLSGAKWLIITLGTAIVYLFKESGSIAANCHKLPPNRFERQMMTVEEIIQEFDKMMKSLTKINSNIQIMLTVSPVRHLKEGFENNQVSKSILRLACDSIATRNDNVVYFPAYEIMMDDLRDYRFYAEDLVHPNSLAIEYIWEKFMDSGFDEETRDFIAEWGKILKALNHKPFYPGTAEHKQFIRETIIKLQSFRGKVNVEEEIKKLNDQL